MGRLLIPRRSILKAAAAAPLILASRKAEAVLHHGSVTPAAITNDITAQTLATLADLTWSSDLVPNGFHSSDVIQPINAPNFQYPDGTVGLPPTGSDYWTFSGGCYLPGLRAFMLPGSGGHGDWLGNQILRFDVTTGKWTRTEDSSRFSNLAVDPGNPTTTTETTWHQWPNAAGRRGPPTRHVYGTPEYCPSANVVINGGGGSVPTGGGTFGYYCIDPVSGQWIQNLGFANGMAGATLMTHWLPSVNKLFLYSGGTSVPNQIGFQVDPLTSVQATTHRGDVNGAYPACQVAGPGCLIPDPNNPGFQAVVFFTYTFYSPGNAQGVCYFPKVDIAVPNGQLLTSIISFGNSVPAALFQGTGASIAYTCAWVAFMGNYKTGSTKILVFDWGFSGTSTFSTGLYLLDTNGWTWSGPLSGSAINLPDQAGHPSNHFKNVFVLSEYVTSSYVPIGVIQPQNGQYRVFRIPTSLL